MEVKSNVTFMFDHIKGDIRLRQSHDTCEDLDQVSFGSLNIGEFLARKVDNQFTSNFEIEFVQFRIRKNRTCEGSSKSWLFLGARVVLCGVEVTFEQTVAHVFPLNVIVVCVS